MRANDRKNNQLRQIKIIPHYAKHAEGSCFISFGDTHVICTASTEERVPPFLKNAGQGWVTAEYGMLPRSTHTRIDREAARGKQTGRTQEIQRLIGRSLRSIVDLKMLGERQIKIDCDVIQADGGTRTAAITGAYIALYFACVQLKAKKLINGIPLTDSIAAISCGILKDEALLDLDYEEDSAAETDANFVITGKGKMVEIQATAEEHPFDESQFLEMLQLARQGIKELTQKQLAAIMEQ